MRTNREKHRLRAWKLLYFGSAVIALWYLLATLLPL